MKQLFSLALLLSILGITSCSKDDDKPLTDREKLLSGNTWIYYQYFVDYNQPATKLSYKSGRTQHAKSLAINEVTYKPDGTYKEIDENGQTFNGTWSMTDGGNGTQVTNGKGTFTATIQLLTNKRYEWLAPNGTYGVMIPKGYTADASGALSAFLTSKTWKYDEYYTDFDLLSPNLVFKIGKSNSPSDFSKNRIKYNSDGTYTEIDAAGVTYTGTWTLSGNDLTVVNAQGTFTSTIKFRDANRYEWEQLNGRRGHLIAVE